MELLRLFALDPGRARACLDGADRAGSLGDRGEPVGEGQPIVHKRDVLFRIDPRPMKTRSSRRNARSHKPRHRQAILMLRPGGAKPCPIWRSTRRLRHNWKQGNDAGRRRSFWIEGYFEETQLRGIKVGDLAEVALMAYSGMTVTGHVSGLGRGIDVPDAAPGVQVLPTVNPVFTWVRLAQRILIRAMPLRVESRFGLPARPSPVIHRSPAISGDPHELASRADLLSRLA